MTNSQKMKLKVLLVKLDAAEEESQKEFSVAYQELADWYIDEFGEQAWDDATIHKLRRQVGL